MSIDMNQGVEYLSKKEIDSFPFWGFNEIDDLIYPISDFKNIPGNFVTLYLRSSFTTQNGVVLEGYTIGVKNIFCIVICTESQTYVINKNFLEDCFVEIKKISSEFKIKITPQDFSPVYYKTTVNLSEFENFSGEFNLLKKRTDEERLDCY